MAKLAKQGATMKRNEVRWWGVLLCTLVSLPASAAEFRLAGGLWDYRVSGFQDDRGTITDLKSFAPGTQRDGFLQAEYEHRPSWLPDLAAGYAQVSGSGSQTTSTTPPLPLPLPIPDPMATTTSASGDFRDLDLTLRYAIALGPIRVSPGVTVSWLKGNIVTDDSASGAHSDRDYSNVFPMLHAQVAWPIVDWLRLTAQGDWIKARHDVAWQYSASLELKLLGPLGVYGGWHARRYQVGNGDSFLDARLRGMRYGLLVLF
jgi:hypothetical protein